MIKGTSQDFSYKTVSGQIRNEKTKICFVDAQFCEPDNNNGYTVAYISDRDVIGVQQFWGAG